MNRPVWSRDAEEIMERVPPFVRSMAKKGVETYALKIKADVITPELVTKAKESMMPGRRAGEIQAAGNWGSLNRQTSRLHEEISQFFANEDVDPLTHAFDRKTAVHAGAKGRHLPAEETERKWQECASREDLSPRRVVYVHIPFCRSRCRFCGFYMFGPKDFSSKVYCDALTAEIRASARLQAVKSAPIQAVYLGGGTPTDMEAKYLYRLIRTLRQCLPLSNDCEITVEGRVRGFSNDKIEACTDAGATRFSIGVQSFDETVRKKMGRLASRDEVLDLLQRLGDTRQASVVIDLIYGFPYQDMEVWRKDIATYLEETEIDGFDMYQLNIFRGGLLAQAIEKGVIPPAADIPGQAHMFSLGRKMCMDACQRRLSVNHWARSTRERNIYNQYTKLGATCIPFGCGAGGRLHGHYFFQEGGLKEYYRKVSEGKKPVATVMELHEKNGLFTEIAGGMEGLSLDFERLSERHSFNTLELFNPLLEQWIQTGLMEIIKDRWLVPTEAGEFWCVNLAQAMIDYYCLVKDDSKKEMAA